MNPRRRSILPLCVLIGLLLAGCGTKQRDTFQGYVEGNFVYIASPLPGTLAELDVARGDDVDSGQTLFRLEREAESAALRQSEMQLAQGLAELANRTKGNRPSEIASQEAQRDRAKANLSLAEAELARAARLHGAERGLISDEDLERAQAQRDAAHAQLEQMNADLRTAQLGAREDEVRAADAHVGALKAALAQAQWAFDQQERSAATAARVDDTLYQPGEWVAAGRPVVVLLPPENRKIRFFVPEPELARFRVGTAVHLGFDGAKKNYRATVRYVSSEAEFTPPVIYSQQNRAKLVFMIEAALAPEDARDLNPGQPVDVSLAVDEA
jgi:HlyD family secretion protein